MKKFFFFLCIFFCVLLLLILLGITKLTPKKKNGTMIIDGTVVTNGDIVFIKSVNKQCVQIPLLVVLEKAGFDTIIKSPHEILIIYKDVKYVLDFNLKTLVEEGKTNNLLVPPPGSNTYICIFTTDDVLIDHFTLKSLFFLMNTHFSIDVDYNRQELYISSFD